MTSEAKDVTAYLEAIPEERIEALTKIREICRSHLVDYFESMEYGMPSYSKNGTVEVGFASQKNNISFYLLKKEVLDKYRHLFAKSAMGKGCIRFSNPGKIDFEMIEKMVKEHYLSEASIC